MPDSRTVHASAGKVFGNWIQENLTPHADAEMTFRFHDSSLDPYVRLFVPKLLPYTTAVASGSIRMIGDIADLDHLLIESTIDRVDVRLFDLALRNARPLKLALDQYVVRIQDLQLVGEDTSLTVGGSVDLGREVVQTFLGVPSGLSAGGQMTSP